MREEKKIRGHWPPHTVLGRTSGVPVMECDDKKENHDAYRASMFAISLVER